MKKIIILCLTIVFLTSIGAFVGCNKGNEHSINALGHTVNEIERIDATCEDEGYVVYACECGAEMHATLEALGHDFEEISRAEATCVSSEKVVYGCTRCEEEKEEHFGEELGHIYNDSFTAELTVVQPCTRVGCDYATLQEEFFENVKGFVENVTSYTQIDDEFLAPLETTYYRMQFIIEDVGAYVEGEHAYDENSELVDVNANFETYFNNLGQYFQVLEVAEACANVQKGIYINDEAVQENYIAIGNAKSAVQSQYGGFLQKAYASALREYFFHGWTEEDLAQTLGSLSSGVSNPELVTLQQRNAELIMKIEVLSSTHADDGELMIYANDDVLELYEEFVANNNRIAQIVGGVDADGEYVYPNGLYYTYEQEFKRDYTPNDVVAIYENVLEHIVPLYKAYEERYEQIKENEMLNWTDEQKTLLAQLTAYCLNNEQSNQIVNEFLKNISVTYGGETTNYYDAWVEMANKGNLLTGELSQAYSTYVPGVNSAIMFIGNRTDKTKTFVHEFGHYVNFYLKRNSGESVDLMETHSQGLELLHLSYLNKNKLQIDGAEAVYEYYNVLTIHNHLDTVLSQLSIDRFESAVYSNTYDGEGADVIMADGKITKEEYDVLYKYIAEELGLTEYAENDYWRLNAGRFGYNISYSVSLICSLQLYSVDNFEDNVEKYAKLINYYQDKEKQNYTYEQVLEYAGFSSYNDRALFSRISDLFALPSGDGVIA